MSAIPAGDARRTGTIPPGGTSLAAFQRVNQAARNIKRFLSSDSRTVEAAERRAVAF